MIEAASMLEPTPTRWRGLSSTLGHFRTRSALALVGSGSFRCESGKMPSTPLHQKPIIYGSTVFDLAFLVLTVLHFVPAAIAPVASIVAFTTKKGGAAHLRWGRWFVRSMWVVATTGIVIDVIRLMFHVQ